MSNKQEKKGYITAEPTDCVKCSVCGLEPENETDITNDNWETCWGRNMFFCPIHRAPYPCRNGKCQADICFNFHDEENWENFIEEWNYDEEYIQYFASYFKKSDIVI